MNRNILLYVCFLIFGFTSSCKLCEEEPKSVEVYGCTDSLATNYNPEATIDDGSCEYCEKGSAAILITTDGGKNWDIRCSQEKVGSISDISIVDSNNIWLCTYPNDNIANAQILCTANGGRTWAQQCFFESIHPTFISFEYIEMFDLYNGIALANDWNNYVPMFLKTTDGGINWERTTTEAIGISGDIWRRVDFVDVNIGYFYESLVNPQKLYKTTDSGITWTETNFDGQAQVLKFFNEDIGIVLYHNKIYRTTDGSNSWTTIDTPHIGWGIDIEFAPDDPSKVWITKYNNSNDFYFSADTGKTWVTCSAPGGLLSNNTSSILAWYGSNLYIINQSDCQKFETVMLPNEHNGIKIGFEDNFDSADDNVIVIPGHIY